MKAQLKTEGKFISLPGLESIKKKALREKVADLLEEAHLIDSYIKSKAVRLDEIKDELLLIQEDLDLPGFRNGPLTFAATWNEGRRSLNKDLLIENGVSPEQIASSYKDGDGFWKKELKRIEE